MCAIILGVTHGPFAQRPCLQGIAAEVLGWARHQVSPVHAGTRVGSLESFTKQKWGAKPEWNIFF